MRVRIRVRENAEETCWALAKVLGLIAIAGALVSSTSTSPVAANSRSGGKVVVPATIRAAHVAALTVSSPAKVRRILVTPGTAVRAGQLLAELESPEAARRLELARRRMAAARARQNPFADRDEQAGGRIPQAAREQRPQNGLELPDVQAAMLRLEPTAGAPSGAATAQLELDDARAALRDAQRRYDELEVKAPLDGLVSNTMAAVGDRVFAGSPILCIADPATLSFESIVTPHLARQIKPGDKVRLRVPTHPPRQVNAQVSRVALAPGAVQQRYVVRAVIANPDREATLVGMEGGIEFPGSESTWRPPF